MNLLEQLRDMTVVVADTGDIEAIAQYRPQDATTNPSLLYKAAQMSQYQHIVKDAVEFAQSTEDAPEAQLDACLDKLAVGFGKEILQIIPGRVSTEVDAHLSFDTEATVAKAHRLIDLYAKQGVDRKRILIKIASTWEGIRAAERLEKDGIHCNLTLLFSFPQAVACAEAGVTLISPFVGRIHDWYLKDRGVKEIAATEDPGVHSVQKIYRYFKTPRLQDRGHGRELPQHRRDHRTRGLRPADDRPRPAQDASGHQSAAYAQAFPDANGDAEPKIHLDEKSFRWMLNEDAMATEKLSEGIRRFAADLVSLKKVVAKLMKQPAGV